VDLGITGRKCENCGVPISGRSDKRFCGKKCKQASWYKSNPKYYPSRYAANPKQVNLASAKWRKKNTGYKVSYRSAHPKETKASAGKWRALNAESNREYNAAWRAANPDYFSKYRFDNPERRRIYQVNRDAREKNNGGKLSLDISSRLLSLQRGKCSVCRASLKKYGYHLDHIIPLCRGGKNEDGNIQATCPKCNTKKGKKDPIKFMREQGYLL
jgi:5-methylcytosine-specific restriction endonuclease McrA